ncbi:DUF2163 domain-containing protein [Glycocaulis sp.]|uniref:DUF2163 domain-containing protein n=1 Tax=Glycocaulis sp. TaxID=1969725 RepID=UPI003D206C35
MLSLPPAMQAALDSGVTQLAWCWLITRRDGVQLGFTDHDGVLDIDGVACEPGSGLIPGHIRADTGSPARGAAFGAVSSDRISAADIAKGLYDGARVEVWRVDWAEPETRVRVFTGEIGEIRRSGAGFEVELAGLSARLNRRIGRVFSKTCDAELGDARCGVNVSAPAYTGAGSVVELASARSFAAEGLAGFTPGWFAHGRLVWLTGANEGAAARVETHELRGGAVQIALAGAPVFPMAQGDTFQIVAGCDGRAATCRAKFANFARFRGCPHIPGNDVLVRHAGSEPVRDGGRR